MSSISSSADAEISQLSSTIERRKAEMAALREKRAARRSALEVADSNKITNARVDISAISRSDTTRYVQQESTPHVNPADSMNKISPARHREMSPPPVRRRAQLTASANAHVDISSDSIISSIEPSMSYGELNSQFTPYSRKAGLQPLSYGSERSHELSGGKVLLTPSPSGSTAAPASADSSDMQVSSLYDQSPVESRMMHGASPSHNIPSGTTPLATYANKPAAMDTSTSPRRSEPTSKLVPTNSVDPHTEELKMELEKHRRHSDELQSRLQQEIRKYEEHLMSTKAELKAAQDEILHYHDQLQTSQTDVRRVSEQLEYANRRNSDLDVENRRLQTHIEEQARSSNNLHNQLEVTTSAKLELEAEVARLTDTALVEARSVHQLRIDNKVFASKINSYEKEIEELENESGFTKDQLNIQASELTEARAQLEAELENSAAAESREQQFRADITHLQQEVAQQSLHIQQYVLQAGNYDAQIADLQKALHHSQTQLQTIQLQPPQAPVTAPVAMSDEDIESSRIYLQLKQNHTATSERLARSEAELSHFRNQVSEVSAREQELQQQLDAMSAQLNDTEEELASTVQHYKEQLETVADNLAGKHEATIDRMQAEMEVLSKHSAQRDQQLSDLQELYAKVQRDQKPNSGRKRSPERRLNKEIRGGSRNSSPSHSLVSGDQESTPTYNTEHADKTASKELLPDGFDMMGAAFSPPLRSENSKLYPSPKASPRDASTPERRFSGKHERRLSGASTASRRLSGGSEMSGMTPGEFEEEALEFMYVQEQEIEELKEKYQKMVAAADEANKYAQDLNRQLEQSNNEVQHLRSKVDTYETSAFQNDGSRVSPDHNGLSLPYDISDAASDTSPSRVHSNHSSGKSSTGPSAAADFVGSLAKFAIPARSDDQNVLPTSAPETRASRGISPRGNQHSTPHNRPQKSASTAQHAEGDRNEGWDRHSAPHDHRDEEITRLQSRIHSLEIQIENEKSRNDFEQVPYQRLDGPRGDIISELSAYDASGTAAIKVRREESVSLLSAMDTMESRNEELISEIDRLKMEINKYQNVLDTARSDDGPHSHSHSHGNQLPFNALNSDEDNLTAQVNSLLRDPKAVMCLAKHLVTSLPPYMSLLEMYIRSLYSIYNPKKLLLVSGGGAIGAQELPVFDGVASLLSPDGYSADDNVSKLMLLYSGKEQEMIDDLKTKYNVPRYMVARIPSGNPHGDAQSNNDAQRLHQDTQKESNDKSMGALANANAHSARLGNLLWTAVLQAVVWTLLLSVGYLLVDRQRSEGLPSVRLAT